MGIISWRAFVATLLIASFVLAAIDQASAAERRIALVIANAKYDVGTLTAPANDGKLVADTLREIGFSEVIERHDLGLAAMGDALKELAARTGEADWVMLYYAGHGLFEGGVAYMLPTDAKLNRAEDILREGVALEAIWPMIKSARKLRLAIIDASFLNPFRRGPIQNATHFLPSESSFGADILIALSTKEGTAVADQAQVHSPYSKSLAKHMMTRDLDILAMFNRVKADVSKATNNRQIPFVYGSVGNRTYYFYTTARQD